MHGLIKDRLEQYLSGTAGKTIPAEFEQHLRTCDECREEVSWMQEQSRLLRVLAPSREVEPAAGFYARVLGRIESRERTSVWTAFLDPIFGRRLAATALAVAGLFVGYLAFTEATSNSQQVYATDSAMVNDNHPPLGVDRNQDRETVFVTLATYRE